MGNVPSESNMGENLRCCKCDIVLPPCKSFDDFHKSTVHGQLVYVFNGGEYYRPVGADNMYECACCFNKPIRDQEEETGLPAECNMGDRLRCCKCDKVLPPCKSFNDLYVTTLNEQRVYVFNGGEYYRPYEVFKHECAKCFESK